MKIILIDHGVVIPTTAVAELVCRAPTATSSTRARAQKWARTLFPLSTETKAPSTNRRQKPAESRPGRPHGQPARVDSPVDSAAGPGGQMAGLQGWVPSAERLGGGKVEIGGWRAGPNFFERLGPCLRPPPGILRTQFETGEVEALDLGRRAVTPPSVR